MKFRVSSMKNEVFMENSNGENRQIQIFKVLYFTQKWSKSVEISEINS